MAGAQGSWRRWRRAPRGSGRRVTDVSLATRVALVAVVVTLVSLVVTAVVGLARGNELADELAVDRVVAIGTSKADAVELYIAGVNRQVSSLAASPGTGDAIERLGDAYASLASQPVDTAAAAELTQHYLTAVTPELADVRGAPVGVAVLAPQGSAAIYLQRQYTIPRLDGDGRPIDPKFVVDPGDGSDYSEVHASLHATWAQIAGRSGFDDLYLIDARRNVVVYSARKRIDFATSLDVGPLSGTAFSRLVGSLPAVRGATGVADFTAYAPAGDRPTAFVASPVVSEGTIVGYVAVALAVENVDAVLSGDGQWSGLGDGGDAYLVGSDGTMRSTARTFQESASTFLAEAAEPGPGELTEEQRRRISATGTTALVQPVSRTVFEAAQAGSGTISATDYRGVSVLTAHETVTIDGIEWTVFVDAPTDELDEPIEEYARRVLLAVALVVVVVTFVAVRWSNRLLAPIRSISGRLRAVRGGASRRARNVPGEVDVESLAQEYAIPDRSPREYAELAANIDQMLGQLQVHQRAVEARSVERARLMRQFLPAAVVRRSEEGGGEVLDHVGNASAVVLILDGVGAMVDASADGLERSLLAEIVDEADALASDVGLERIKMTGGMYVAVCGANRPYLDHAVRAAAFGIAVRDLVDEVSEGRLSVRGGVDDGAVSVGLAGRSGLVYDGWGQAIAGAERLARSAPRGGVAVSAVVRRQLPDDFVVVDAAGPVDGVAVVTGRLTDRANDRATDEVRS